MVQKRVFIRLEDFIEVEFSLEKAGITTIIKTKTRDISAGGVKVYLTHRLHVSDVMKVVLSLFGINQVINAEATVVACELIGVVGDVSEYQLYETRFKFIPLNANDRTALIKYIYDRRTKHLDARINRGESNR